MIDVFTSLSKSWSWSEILRDDPAPPKSPPPLNKVYISGISIILGVYLFVCVYEERHPPEAVRVMWVLLLCCREMLDRGRGLSLVRSSWEEGITLCSRGTRSQTHIEHTTVMHLCNKRHVHTTVSFKLLLEQTFRSGNTFHAQIIYWFACYKPENTTFSLFSKECFGLIMSTSINSILEHYLE